MIVIIAIIATIRLRLTSFPTKNLSYNDEIVSVHPRDNSSSTHKFRRPNQVITEYDNDVATRLATLVERQATAADPDLIRLILDMLDPPSSHMVKMSRHMFNTPQSRVVDKFLKQKVKIV